MRRHSYQRQTERNVIRFTMLRILFVTFLSIATLLTAAAWWSQFGGPYDGSIRVTPLLRVTLGTEQGWAVVTVTSPASNERWGMAAKDHIYIPVVRLDFVPVYRVQPYVEPELPTQYMGARVMFPLLLPTVIIAMSWLAWPFVSAALRRRRRRTHGLCVHCAYDLTGNESGACPECGSPVEGDK